MSILVPINGVNYIIPTPNEVGWGSNLDAFFVAIGAGTLQKNGGSFTLSAETDFGASFGIKSLYYKTRASNIATTGAFRLANAETGIVWRNAANNADLALTVNASNQLTFNGATIPSGSGFVSSITGTANQVIASSPTGAVTLSLPQSIATTSTPTFLSLNLLSASSSLALVKGNSTTSTGGTVYVQNDVSRGVQANSWGSLTAATLAGHSLADTGMISSDRSLFLTVGTGASFFSFIVNSVEKLLIDSTGITLSSPLAIASGGTNSATALSGSSIMVSNGSSIVQGTAGTTTTVLHGNASGAPTYSAVSLTADVSGTLPVANGGTGDASFTAYAVLAGGTTSTGPLQQVSGVGSSGQVLTSNGAATLPTWQNVAGSGTVNSGTANTLAYYAASTNVVGSLAAITASRALVSDTNGLPVAATTTTTEIGYVNGVTSAIQTQLDSTVHLAGTETITGAKTFSSSSGVSITGGNLSISRSVVGTVTATVSNTGTGNTADHAQVAITTANTGGTATVKIDSGGNATVMGVDPSDGFFKIYANSTFGSGTLPLRFGSGGAVSILGTSTNDSASAGYVGQYIESVVALTNFGTSTQYADLTSISLTTGDWDVSLGMATNANGATVTGIYCGISTTSGNSATGLVLGSNLAENIVGPTAGVNQTFTSIPSYRVSLSGTTTVYFKYRANFSVATPQAAGRISARRVR